MTYPYDFGFESSVLISTLSQNLLVVLNVLA